MTHEESIRSQLDPSTPLWSVTVLVEGNEPETHVVNETREGLAKTTAMALYRQPIGGREVRYEVKKLRD